MDTESVERDVNVMAWHDHTPPSEFSNNVVIIQDREIEEFVINMNDGSVKRLRSYPDPSPFDQQLYLNFRSFQPTYVYQSLHNQLHDHVLSEQIADQILAKVQQETSQSLDLPQQINFVLVFVNLTQKLYKVVPSDSATLLTDSDQESPEEESETCPICLENLSRSEDYYQLHYCSHGFHESCVIEWLNQQKNSCPLCRKPVYI